MMMSNQDLSFALVKREELAQVLRGESDVRDRATPAAFAMRHEISSKSHLLVWHEQSPRPIAIVVPPQSRDDLLAWLVTFHSDLAPLTSWCHLVSSEDFTRYYQEVLRFPSLNGLETGWLGAIIAEAMASSNRDVETLSLSACLATDTFAVARTAALYGAKNALSSLERLDAAKQSLQPKHVVERSKSRLPVEVLLSLMPGGPAPSSRNISIIVDACKSLAISGDDAPTINNMAVRELAQVSPLFDQVAGIEKMPAENRIRLLRKIKEATLGAFPGDNELYNFVAGYIISRVGGAERDFRLADDFRDRGEVLTWTAISGGLGVETFWTNAFGGLGRLLAKELLRPFSLCEFPDADISGDELRHLEARAGRPSFRTSSRNAAVIALRPGVNVTIALGEVERPPTRNSSPPLKESAQAQLSLDINQGQIEMLVERLLPLLESRLAASLPKSGRYSKGSKSQK